MPDKLNFWERWLDSWSSEGGHIAIMIVVIVMGAVLLKIGVPEGRDLIVGAGAVLFASLKNGVRSNNTRRNTVVDSETTIKTEEKPA